MATYQIINLNTGEFSTLSLEEAAALAELDPHEIEWAIGEHGVCETGTFQITKLNDPPEDGHSSGDQNEGDAGDDGDDHSPADGSSPHDQPVGDDGDAGDADSQFLTPVFVYISQEEFEAHLAEHPAAVIRLSWDEPIVRSVVEAHDGTVRVSSTLGAGSEFAFSIPGRR